MLDKRDIVAIHRLPASFSPIPVIIKCFNSEVKSARMRQRKDCKETAVLYLTDDVTRANLGLTNRLFMSKYFNCGIYGKSVTTQKRVKFDVFDIDSVLQDHMDKLKEQKKNDKR